MKLNELTTKQVYKPLEDGFYPAVQILSATPGIKEGKEEMFLTLTLLIEGRPISTTLFSDNVDRFFSNVAKAHPKFDGELPIAILKELVDTDITLPLTVWHRTTLQGTFRNFDFYERTSFPSNNDQLTQAPQPTVDPDEDCPM